MEKARLFLILIFGLVTAVSCSKEDDSIIFGNLSDIEGNEYKTIVIGNQRWMAENLRTGHYKDGSLINHITDNSQWGVTQRGAWCWYDNDELNSLSLGALYNFYAVESDSLCPYGWRVPTKQDWEQLITNAGGPELAGGNLKSEGTLEKGKSLWAEPNEGGLNNTGFSAQPGGVRYAVGTPFDAKGVMGFWWSSTSSEDTTKAVTMRLYNYWSGVEFTEHAKPSGFSVRCVRDI